MTPVSICCHSAGGEDARDQVERQDAVDRGGVGIDGEGDAAFQQVAFGVGGAAAQGGDRQDAQDGRAAASGRDAAAGRGAAFRRRTRRDRSPAGRCDRRPGSGFGSGSATPAAMVAPAALQHRRRGTDADGSDLRDPPRAIGRRQARPGAFAPEPHQEALPPGPPPRAAPLEPFTSLVGREGGDRGEVCLDQRRGKPRRDHPPPVQPAKQMDCKGSAFAGRSRRAAPSWWVSGRSPDLACFTRLPWRLPSSPFPCGVGP